MRSNTQRSIKEIKERGKRVTKVRASVLELLEEHARPMSVEELRQSLRKRGLAPNKTTVYRELAFLVTQGLVQEVDLGERKKRYESVRAGHHHHLICVNCHSVSEIRMGNHLKAQEALIRKQEDFEVQRHALEFFGLCGDCRK